MLKNIVYNFSGQGFSIVAAVVGLPFALRFFGPEGFGLLSLAMSFVNAAGVLDLGLGRSSAKFVAERSSKGNMLGACRVIWASLFVQLALGLVAVVLYFCFGPLIVGMFNLVSISSASALRIGGIVVLTFPFTLVNGVLRGGLEGRSFFGAVNIAKVIQNGSLYFLPAACGALGFTVEKTVILLAASRLIVTLFYIAIYLFRVPEFRNISITASFREGAVFKYSGWLAVSNVSVVMLTNVDRVMLASAGGIAAVGYYSVLMEVFNGATVVAGNISNVLFPIFSKLTGKDIGPIYVRGVRGVLLFVLPVVSVLLVCGYGLFEFWQGGAVANACGQSLKVVAIAVFVSSVGWVPTVLLLGLGRARIVAGVQWFQVLVLVVLASILFPAFGLLGAAFVLLVRTTVETGMLLYIAARVTRVSISAFVKNILMPGYAARFAWAMLLIVLLCFFGGVHSPAGLFTLIAIFAALYFLATWPVIVGTLGEGIDV